MILCETGIVGLGTFLVLIVGELWRGMVNVRRIGGVWRAAYLGLLVGIIGQLVQQTMDFSLWIDPGWYTFGLIVALLTVAPEVGAGDRGDGGISESRVEPARPIGPGIAG